jgi:hypothetical protein
VKELKSAGNTLRFGDFLAHNRPLCPRLGLEKVGCGDPVSSERLAILHLPPYPVLVARKHSVYHSVIEFAIWAFLQVLCDGGLDAQCPLGLCFMVSREDDDRKR